jgi:hypothetical protein
MPVADAGEIDRGLLIILLGVDLVKITRAAGLQLLPCETSITLAAALARDGSSLQKLSTRCM